jgi:hypothetical protein
VGAALVYGAQAQVDLDIAELEHRAERRTHILAASRGGAHARQELSDAERLGQVVVGAGIQGLDLVLLAHASGQHDHRNLRPAAQIAQEPHPIAVRQTQIEDDQIGLASAGIRQPLTHGLGLDDAPAFGLERRAHEAPDLPLVLDQNRDGQRFSHAPIEPRSRPPAPVEFRAAT